MSITGTWKNNYGSLMSLWQTDGGQVIGSYSSSTGASGSYLVAGYCDPAPATGVGQSLALSLLWRSLSGGTPDPSWHWVSGFSGQAVEQTGGPALILIHDLVATCNDPGVADVGSYIDKLIYLPSSANEATAPERASEVHRSSERPAIDDPVNGRWKCTQTGATLALQLQDRELGLVQGTLTTAAGTSSVVGFVDAYAKGDQLTLEGVTLTSFGDARASSWSGWLDLQADVMTLLLLRSSGTTIGNAYVQTNTAGLQFTRA